MSKNVLKTLVFLLALGLFYFLGYYQAAQKFDINSPKENTTSVKINTSTGDLNEKIVTPSEKATKIKGVPDKVYEVLEYIDTHQKAPKGYVGGRKFNNYEGLLPKISDKTKLKIDYQEWDVNPKVKGQNRGAERLVTGNDKSAYYTQDHYRSFTQIR